MEYRLQRIQCGNEYSLGGGHVEYEQKRSGGGWRGLLTAFGILAIGLFLSYSASIWVARDGSRGELIADLEQAQADAEQAQRLISDIGTQNEDVLSRLSLITSNVRALQTNDDKLQQSILADLAATTNQINEINKGSAEFLGLHGLTINEHASFSLVPKAEASTTHKVKNQSAPPTTFLDQINDPAHRMLFVIMGALAVGGVFTILYAVSKVPAKQKFYQTVIINVGTFLAGLGGGAFIAG